MSDKSQDDDLQYLRPSSWDSTGEGGGTLQIADVYEKAQDLVGSLREAGAGAQADEIVKITRAFKSPTEVRRALFSLQQQLELWRQKKVLPPAINIQFEAQQLEDACRLILGIGSSKTHFQELPALVLSPMDRVRPYLRLALATFLIGAVVFGGPLALAALGIDWLNYHFRYETELIHLSQGVESATTISILADAKMPKKTNKVNIYPANRCKGSVYKDWLKWQQWVCTESQRKLSSDGSPTYEMTQEGQYYGLLFAIADTRLVGGAGSGTVQLFATETTPTGIYKIPLEGGYRGYRPGSCWGFGILKKCNPSIVDEYGEDRGLRVPTVVVQVDKSRSTGDVVVKTRAEIKEAEKVKQRVAQEQFAIRQAREVLAGQILDAMSELETIRKCLARKDWTEARARLDKITVRQNTLNAEVKKSPDPSFFQAEMTSFQSVLDEQRQALDQFEDQALDEFFRLLQGTANTEGDRRNAMAKAANLLGIPTQYLERIYSTHSGEVQIRLKKASEEQAAREAAAWQAAQARCGSPPLQAASAVDRYLRKLLNDPTGSVDECSPPRFSDKDCWVVTCAFTAEDETGMPKKVNWTFLLEYNEVTRHRPYGSN